MRLRISAFVAVLAVALSACQFGNPEPATRPAGVRSPHRTLLMIGDSLMGQLDFVVHGVLADHGVDATVIDAHINASGLIGPVGDAPTALAWVQEQVAEHPEANPVVIERGGECRVCGTTVGGVEYPALGDAEAGFYDMWVTNAYAIIDWLHAQGKTVVWAISPPFGPGAPSVPLQVETSKWLSMLDSFLIGPHASSPPIDWFAALADTDREYATSLFYDNAFHTVRTDDLTHLTLDGAKRASTWSVSVLVDVLAAMPPPDSSTASLPLGLVEAGDPVELRVSGGGL
jgi:hypothetical protein